MFKCCLPVDVAAPPVPVAAPPAAEKYYYDRENVHKKCPKWALQC